MHSHRPGPLSLLLSAGVALTLLGCGQKAEGSKEEDTSRPVRALPVTSGVVVETVEVVGELQGIQEVKVFPQTPERIRSLPVKEGQRVKKGEVLAILYGELQSEAVNQSAGALEAARANRDNLEESLKRIRQLVEAGSVARSQLDTLEAQFRAADAQVRQASAGLNQASAQQGRTVITAPISGVVAQLTLRQGDLASGQAPILTVVQDDRLRAVFRVPERDFLRIRVGMPVTLSPLADPSQKVKATVTLRGPVVDRLTRTGLVEVHLDNDAKDGALLAGSAMRAEIELGRREGVVLVPAAAVLLTSETERTGKALAFVTDGKLAQRREVVVGARQDGALEIQSGLKPGESLIVQGAHFLRDGQPVTVLEQPVAQENG